MRIREKLQQTRDHVLGFFGGSWTGFRRLLVENKRPMDTVILFTAGLGLFSSLVGFGPASTQFILIILYWFFQAWMVNKKEDERRIPGAPQDVSFAKYRTSVHEAGHALTAFFSRRVSVMVKATSEPEGNTSGKFLFVYESSETAESVYEQVAISMGGIAAEAVVFGKFDSGRGSGDLLESLALSRKVKASDLPPWEVERDVTVTWDLASAFVERPTSTEQYVMIESYRRSKALVRHHRPLLEKLAAEIASKGTLDQTDLKRLLGERPWALRN